MDTYGLIYLLAVLIAYFIVQVFTFKSVLKHESLPMQDVFMIQIMLLLNWFYIFGFIVLIILLLLKP